MTESGVGEGPALINLLAACDKSSRDRAVRSLLNSWLPSRSEISDEEMKKLWKGLFYCVWHADKMPAQSDLIEKLSSVLPKLEPSLPLQYFSVFLLTMRREWPGIDNLRVFVDRTFLADDKFQGNGVNYHIASVFLEEIKPFLPIRKEVVEVLLEPLVGILGKVDDKILVGKIRSNVFDVFVKMGRRLLELKRSGDNVDDDDDVGNRKTVLALHEEFLKLKKDLTSLGIDISIPEINEDSEEDEVPELIPIASEVDVSNDVSEGININGSAKKAVKKSKKVKTASGGSEDTSSNIKQNGDGDSITFTESVVSNLQLQFEKVAAEVDIQANILPEVTHWQSPNYFAYYPSNSSVAGFLGEMLSTGQGGRVIQGTASEAVLVVLLAARDNVLRVVGKDALEKLVVYASDQTHSSLQKACQIAGIHPENCRLQKANSSTNYALSPELLSETISHDLTIGF
ncbi:Tyrosine decarboxylase 1 [Hibiscus syriacus]|uniref:Tyrosine decarboxylase 1 n=1 Tax=Hibiscus syriacus TaxID=106335 RepID=A0A6A3CET9_HIBSY|nr:Tyrosine decarboxylase 1 [Hibiscus syriacus]